MANTTVVVITPVHATFTNTSAQALDAAVTAAVNTLVQAYIDPGAAGAAGAVAGNVVVGSIKVSDTRAVSANNVITYYASINSLQYVIPT